MKFGMLLRRFSPMNTVYFVYFSKEHTCSWIVSLENVKKILRLHVYGSVKFVFIGNTSFYALHNSE